ncbi:MYG1 exonuclease isoform X2 [Bombus pyrosoma]|nr:MYG1 exonuclease isoform X2 [Bombus pyrosoma]XP_043602055.1 MYG1 exonuclease isoform X2 [Bombus pyrosoma]
MIKNVKIGTHDGTFHCDEALACFMLKTLPRYKDAVIVRSRDMNILDACDIVVDVGGEYNPSMHRYDHHMRDFNESVSTVIKKPGYDWTMKLSSAGLIYCHFGHEVIKHLIPQANDSDVEMIFKHIYDTFIKEIDGIDNGVTMFNEEPVYRIVTDLSSRVKLLNPAWNSKDINIDSQFFKAVELTGKELVQHINYVANAWLPAKSIVQEAIDKRFEVDPSGEIIELLQFVPWSEHLYAIEKEQNVQPPLKFVIFGNGANYRVRAIPVAPDSFVCRLFLPESWGGLHDEELVSVSGIKDAVFVHSKRFIGAHLTREGAITMARKALEIGKAI